MKLLDIIHRWLSNDTPEYVWSAEQVKQHADWLIRQDAYPVMIKEGGYYVRDLNGKNIKPPTTEQTK